MKKKLTLILPIIFLLGLFALPVFAADIPKGPETINEVIEIIDRAANWLFMILIAVAVVMIVYAGITWMTAAGDEEKMKTSRRTLLYALVGVGIGAVAKGLVAIMKTLVG